MKSSLISSPHLSLSSLFRGCHHYELGANHFGGKKSYLPGLVLCIKKQEWHDTIMNQVQLVLFTYPCAYDLSTLMHLDLSFPFHYYIARIQLIGDLTTFYLVNSLLLVPAFALTNNVTVNALSFYKRLSSKDTQK